MSNTMAMLVFDNALSVDVNTTDIQGHLSFGQY